MNWFASLNEALLSENLLEVMGDYLITGGINYGETHCFTVDDGSKYGYLISIYRDERGLYERPIHYPRG
jgi:hypothetical protein